MRKIIHPVRCEIMTGMSTLSPGFVEIVFETGRLSMHGVIGPLRSGNCRGSCGQCIDEIREGFPADGWTREMVDKLCDIWERWHLNDMRAYCEHQKSMGWDKLAREPITFYNYSLNKEAMKKRHEAESAAMPQSLVVTKEIKGELTAFYEPKKPLFAGDRGPTSTQQRGWIRFDEFEEGILCKPCPVCGYKYGTQWLKEEVPEEVIDWLFALPNSDKKPAWI